MARFNFRLEPVLQVRKMREQAVQQELAHMEQDRQAAERELTRTTEEIAETMHVSAVDLASSLHCEYYREALKERKVAQESVLQDRCREVQEKRDHLVRVMQDRLVLEKLREKQVKLFRSRESARETKELDDLGAMAFCFKYPEKGGE